MFSSSCLQAPPLFDTYKRPLLIISKYFTFISFGPNWMSNVSPLPMDSSSLVDPSDFDELGISRSMPFAAGYLDNVLTIFSSHNHPFILVGALAMQWSGSNPLPDIAIDILVSTSQVHAILDDLIASHEWTLSSYPASETSFGMNTYQNCSSVKDFWLVSTEPNSSGTLGFQYLRLWPEHLYHISIADCTKLENPDLIPRMCVLKEEEYYRDPHNRFGPRRLSVLEARSEQILLPASSRCRLRSRNIAIYIPSIQDHLNALLYQRREEYTTGRRCGNAPEWHINNFIRYHVWDWPPASGWLLNEKVREDNRKDIRSMLKRFVRKRYVRHDKVLGKILLDSYPWELTPD